MMLKSYLLALSLILCVIPSKSTDHFPKVFEINKNIELFEALNEKYSVNLIQAFDGDVKQAFNQWQELLREMEAYANKMNFPIRGLKIWLKIYVDDKGKIKHIGFEFKPNSKNISRDLLKDFLIRYIQTHQIPPSASTPFSHYGVAAFPIQF